MRVTLDNNVLVSALVRKSPGFAWLRPAWRKRIVVPLASEETTAELVRVIQYPKFQLTPGEMSSLLADYLPWCEMVVTAEPPAVPPCRDPNDIPFLELALAGRADALVSGDSDLLVLKPVFPVPIVRPAELRAMLQIAGD